MTSDPNLTEGVDDPPEWFEPLRELGRQWRLPYEWSAVGLWSRDDGQTALSTVDRLMHLTFPSDNGGRLVHTVLGEGRPRNLLDILAETDAVERVVRASLTLTEEPDAVLRVPDRRYADYVYDLGEQASLSGKRFARRRTYLRSLSGRERQYDEVNLDLTKRRARASILAVNARWASGREPDPLIAAESSALSRLLDAAYALPVNARGITCDNELVAFGIFDVNGEHATAHFVKSPRDSAVTAFVWQAIFEAARKLGALTMNAGYDGGILGLRTAKTNLVPREIVLKETLTLDV